MVQGLTSAYDTKDLLKKKIVKEGV